MLSCTILPFAHCESLSPSTRYLKWNHLFNLNAVGKFALYYHPPPLLLNKGLIVQVLPVFMQYWNHQPVVLVRSALLRRVNGPGQLFAAPVSIKSSSTLTSFHWKPDLRYTPTSVSSLVKSLLCIVLPSNVPFCTLHFPQFFTHSFFKVALEKSSKKAYTLAGSFMELPLTEARRTKK